MVVFLWILAGLLALLAVVAAYDVTQRRHAITHNYPVIGHFRYWLEFICPELRQYLVAADREEQPASISARHLVEIRPATAESAWIATRTMLFSGCCAVSVEPPVWAWKRSASAFGFVAPKRSRMMLAQSLRAARNFATSWKK